MTRIVRDPSKMSKSAKLQAIMNESPELLSLLEESKGKVDELKNKIMPLMPLVKKVSVRSFLFPDEKPMC